MAGNEALQGAHHEAQKSTSTTFPRTSGSLSPPPSMLKPAAATSGKGSPALISARAAIGIATSTATGKIFMNLRSHIIEKTPGLRAYAIGDEQTFGTGTGLNEIDSLRDAEHERRRR